MSDKTRNTNLILQKNVRNTASLTFAERGLLAYMLDHVNEHGQFFQPLKTTADDNASTPPTVHRLTKDLIRKQAVKVVAPAFRGHDGWMVPPVLIPIPQVEQATSNPIPQVEQVKIAYSKWNTEPLTVNKPVLLPDTGNVSTGISTNAGDKMEWGLQRTQLELDPIQQLKAKLTELKANQAKSIASLGDGSGWDFSIRSAEKELSRLLEQNSEKADAGVTLAK